MSKELECDLTEFEGMKYGDLVDLIKKEYPQGLHEVRSDRALSDIGFNVCRYYYDDPRPAILHTVRDILDPYNQPLSYGFEIANHVNVLDHKDGPLYEVVTG